MSRFQRVHEVWRSSSDEEERHCWYDELPSTSKQMGCSLCAASMGCVLGCVLGLMIFSQSSGLDELTSSASLRYEEEWGPAISSSAGPPNTVAPLGVSMDFSSEVTLAKNYSLSDHSPVHTVRKVNVGSLPYGHPFASFEYPKHEGFTLWLVEEFEEPLDLLTDPIWTYSDGGLTEGQVRFVKDAIKFQHGLMLIEVSNRGLPQGSRCSHAESGFVGNKRLTSGELRSRYNMFRYGRYEVRMKAPSVQGNNSAVNGNFIATMFVYRDGKFKHWREIDFEVTGNLPNSVTANVLKGDHQSTWSPGIQSSARLFPKGLDVRGRFHTYSIEWLPSQITWAIDGNVQRVHKGLRVPVPEMSTKIMMNLWIFNSGGFGGGAIGNNHYPMHSEYDWFRFYKWDKDAQYPCLAMDKTCLTEDDQFMTGNNPCDGIPQLGRSACVGTCSFPSAK